MAIPLRVLILEDRPADAELVLHELRRAGFEPVWQRVETEADFLSGLDPALDLILADYSLPQFDGVRALHLLQERGLDIPFIIVSGTIGEEVAVAAMREGAADYLFKDRLTRLGPAVEQALEQNRLRGEKRQAAEALRDREARLVKAQQVAHMGFLDWDLKTNELFCSDEVHEMYGVSREEVPTSPEFIAKVVHPDDMEYVQRNLDLAVRGVKRYDIDHRINRPDGKVLWVQAQAELARDADGNPETLLGTIVDITERKRAEEEVQHHLERIEALREIDKAITSTLDLTEVLDIILEELERVIPYHSAGVFLITDGTAELAAGRGFPDIERALQISFPVEEDLLTRQVLHEKRPLVLADAQADERFAAFGGTEYVRSWIGVPLMAREKALGFLTIDHREPGVYGDESAEMAQAFASQVAIAIENARLYEEAQQELAERKRAQEELSVAYDALGSSVNGVIIADLEGNIKYANPAFLRMFQYENRDEVIGKRAAELFPAERVQKFADVTTIIDKVKGETEEFLAQRKDGTGFPVEVSSSIVTDQTGNDVGRMASFVDITGRKQAEEQILRQSAVLKAINEVFQEALTCETDEEVARTCLAVAEELTGSKFGFIGEVNQAGRMDTIAISNPGWDACKMPDSEATVLTKNMEIRGIDRSVLREEKSRIVNDPASHPDRVGTPEGHLPITSFLGVPLKQAGRTIGMIGLANKESGYDLADQQAVEALSVAFVEALYRKRAEDTLGKSEQRFRTVADFTYDWEYWIGPDGNYIYVSPSCERITGYRPDEFERDPGLLEAITHPDDRARIARHIHETLESSEVHPIEFRIINRSGEQRCIGHVCQEVYGTDGSWLGRRASNRDITERKRAETEVFRQLETINALYAGAQKLSRSLNLRELAQDIARDCVEVFDARLAWLGRAEQDGSVSVLSHFPAAIEYPRQITVRWDDTAKGQGPTGRAIRSGFPEVNAEMASAPSFAPWQEAASAEGFRTSAAFPLIGRGRTFGALNLYSDQPGFFDGERVEFFQSYAHLVAAALENARLFEEANRRLGHMEALREIDMAITASLDLRVTLNVILDQVTSQLSVDAADMLLFNPHTQTLEYTAGRGFRSRALRHTNLRLGEGYAGRAVFERRMISIPNLEEAQDGLQKSPLLPEEEFVSYYAVPLVAKGQVKGVLEIFHRALLDPGPEWLDFLDTLAGQSAIAIDNATLFDGLQRSNVELTLAYDTTLEGWARAVALRDWETGDHSHRVTELTVRLARAMGMSDPVLVHVRRGALLHDIGKMGIPDAILHKPGKLTEEEWEIMRQHPVYAHDFLSHITYLRPALDIPYCHHEKWDGTGYPRGLKEETIPLSARIFAVVDVWDALRSDRPYRKAWPQERALAHIQEQAGKHFDPRVVGVFLKKMKAEGGGTSQ